MAIPFLTSINLRGNETQNQVLHLTSSDPTTFISSAGGNIYYNTNSDVVKYYDGSTSGWQTVASQAWTTSNFLSSSINVVDGSGTANKIPIWTDSDTLGDSSISHGQQGEVIINANTTINDELSMGNAILMDGNPIAELPTPTTNDEAANKAYVDTRSITIGDSTITLGGTDTTLTGLTDIDLTAGNKTIFDGVGNAILSIGAQSTSVFINGNFEVNGSTEMQGLTLGDELNMQDTKIINVGDPTNNADAATKNYVDTRSITIGDSTITIGGTDTTLTGLSDIDLTAANHTIFDNVGANTLTIGAATTTIAIPGDLQVTGTVTTNNVETVSTSNGVIFEGNVADANELTLLAGTLTADRTVTLPNATGTVALTTDPIGINGISGLTQYSAFNQDPIDVYVAVYDDDIGANRQINFNNIAKEIIPTVSALIDVSSMGSNTTASIVHNLNSSYIIVQMHDVTTGEVIFADIDHISSSTTNIIFSSTPTNDIRVNIISLGDHLVTATPTYS